MNKAATSLERRGIDIILFFCGTPKVIENLVAEDITMVVQGSGTSMQLCVIAVSNYTDTAATLNSGYILQSDLN